MAGRGARTKASAAKPGAKSAKPAAKPAKPAAKSAKREAKPAKPAAKSAKREAKPKAKSEAKSEAKPEAKIDRPLIVAMPKGRIAEEAAALFTAADYDLSSMFESSRKLVHDCGPLQVLILRSSDVPTYVAYGAADLGVAGSDVLDEYACDLYEPLDLRIGQCRMIVAEPAARPVDERSQMHLRIATKYPRITKNYLQKRGLTAEVIRLSGSIELGPLTGLAHRIVDITQTGETLRQNGLVEVDTIAHVSSRLVVNPAALKLRGAAISQLISRLEAAVAKSAATTG